MVGEDMSTKLQPVHDKNRHLLSPSNIVSGTKETLPDREVPSVREEAEDTFEHASEGVGERSQSNDSEAASEPMTPPPPLGASARALRAYNRA